MNKRGKIIILCLLICIIFSLQSVCAADNAGNTTNTTINNDLLSIPASNEGVIGAGGGSFAELNTTINGNSDSVVNLNQNYTYNSGETAFINGIIINRAVTINGNGYAIDGAKMARIFDIRSAGVILNNIVFINGNSSSDGGAIEWASNAENGLITNCIFTSNIAADCGGAVYWKGHDGRILNSKFISNKATGTAGTALDSGDGGAIEWIGYNGYVGNCTFTGNDAAVRGGAVFLENGSDIDCGNTTFDNCTFIANHAGTNGGAVDWHEGAHDGKISDCIFEDNSANANGGAVYWRGHHGDIFNSNFTNNTALGLKTGRYGNAGDGGAVFWAGINGTVTNCRFIDNKAKMHGDNISSGRGGAVYIEPCNHGCENTSFHYCVFEDNIADVNGGAINWHKEAHNGLVEACTFTNNTAKSNGGAIHWSGINGTIIDSTFTDNKATGETGTALYTGDGGAVIWIGSNGKVKNSTFKDNTAAVRGGAVFLENNTELSCDNTTFDNCTFISNHAGTNGGAVDWHEGAENGNVLNCIFEDNTANANGGAVYWRGHNGEITNSNFTNNIAKGLNKGRYGNVGDGGAVFWAGMNGTVTNSRFINNKATMNNNYRTGSGRGGAVYLEPCAHGCDNTSFHNCVFEDNVADTNGGAINWHKGASNGLVEDSTFINNTAKRNGGAIFWNGVNGTVKNSKFDNNRATGESYQYDMTVHMGDKIIVETNGTLVLGNIIVIQSDNLPRTTPISSDQNKLFVLNYTTNSNGKKIHAFESWVAHDNGGSLEWLQLDNTTVDIDTISPVDWAIDQFFGGDGGTILWQGNVGLVKNCTFIESNSARRGGGAYMTGCDNVTYESCNFTYCTSGTNGGGVDWLAGANYGKIYNCIFNNTRAARSAGAIYYDGWYGDMRNITIINTQSWGGTLKTSRDDRVNYAGWDSSHWDTNTTGGDAGAIMFTGNHEYLYNVTFMNCNGSGRGGAVFLQDNYNVTFDTCKFQNNIAAGTAKNTYVDDKNISSGLNLWLTGYGGAIAFDVNAHLGIIKNSQFINNTAVRNGGAISFGKGSYDGNITDSTFDDNTAYRNGGAIAWDGTQGTMTNCNFTNNAALGTDINTVIFNLKNLNQIINGTSLPSTSTDINKIYVYIQYDGDKRANYTMYVYNKTAKYWVPLEFTTETGPSTTDWVTDEYFGGDGGTIYWRGDNGTVDNCRFIDSNSARRGGGAYMTGSDHITFKNSYFENCTSGTNGGGLDWLAGANYGQVINCTFNNTRAARSAGAIYYDGDYGKMQNITIINTKSYGGTLEHSTYGRNDVIYAKWDASHWDTNTTGGDAGAIMFTGDHEYVYNVTFINTTSQGRGGAVFLQDNQNITFDSCKFIGDEALGIATNTWPDYTKDRNDNQAATKLDYKLTGHGGAIAFDIGAHDVTIKKSDFIQNYARRDGGAINLALNSYNATIEDCTFTNNSCGDDGGAINWEGNVGLVKNITCYNNKGISFADPETGASNSKGGVICLTGNKVNITESKFTLSTIVNSAGDNDAGAIFITGENTTVSDSRFDKCYAPEQGGAMKIIGNFTTVNNCTFINCNSTEEGGAMVVEGLDCKVYNSTFENIFAGDDGGAILWIGQRGLIYNSTFTNVKALGLNGHKSKGGAVNVVGDNAVIDKSRFNMTSAAQHGGAIYISGKNALINNSNISMSNASYSGGAVYIQGLYATIENSAFSDTLAKLGSSFTGNADPTKATPDNTNMGGAIYIGDNYAKIRNSSFTNSAAYYGGILFLQGQFCDVINSSLDKGYSERDGGAYCSKGINSNVYDSNFTNNVARNDGGALFWLGSKYNYVNGSIFTNNTAKGDPGHSTKGGGAIYFAEGGSYCGISYSKFFNNSAVTNSKADGGAILWDKSSHIFIDHCLFDGNFANSTKPAGNWIQGGVLYARPGTNLTITNNIFQNCWSLKEAGALYLQTGDKNGLITLINNTFINNTAYGNTTETDNFLGGGAVLSKSLGKFTIVNATFINNTANYGGGITIHSSVVECTITNITFDGNKATIGTGCGDGGSIYAKKAFTANNIKISNGVAARNGGGMYVDVEMTYNNFTFINNSAANGGGLYWNKAGVTIEDMTFINNSAVISGGAIFIPTGSSTSSLVYVLNNIFTGNSANSGGAIYAIGNSIIISQNNFTNNSASYRGGAIFIPVSNNGVDIGYSNFTGNKAAADGGAIFIGSKGYDNRKIHDCNFINNSAVDDGGAIYVANANKEIINCYFDGNKADGDGGAVYVAAVQGGKITDSTFTNSLAQNGGAVYYAGTTNVAGALKIVNDTFLKNIAIYNGGAVLYLVGNGPDKYRDYNNFDGIGIPVDGGRTTVKANNTNVEFISTSLFEDNEDYMLRLRVISDWLNPYITVYIDNPRDWNRYGLRVVMNLINSTTHEVIRTVIINESNIDTHRRDGMIYASFGNLIKNETYNITVSFEDYNYLYKVNSTVAQAHGEIIGEFKLLQKLIDEAIDRGDRELVLNRTFTFTPLYEGKPTNMDDRCINLTNIPYAFTIRGEGFVIDAAGYSRIFNITSPNVTIDNVILVGGNASGQFGDGIDMGGAIFWAGPNGIISNSIIEHNNATIGGGIYYNVTAPDCQIINTTFVENTAVTHGGAIDCNASRMGLFNTTFEENFAYVGAALCREINATDGRGKNNTFIGNYAEYAGAALAWINATHISIDDYHFYNNHVGYSGGAIYVGEGSKNCEILNCVFDNNWVENETDGHGGAIEWYSEKGLVYNSNFINNHAYDGGAIYVGSASGEINITKSTFRDNIAVTTGGAISIDASAVTVNASNFYNNNATRGGALFVGGVGTDNYIYGSVFEGNNAISTNETAMNGLGGAIDWVASSGTIVDTRFTDNHADYGGGVYFGENSINSRIQNCLFEGNDAKYNGGAIDCNSSSMYLTNTVFDGNVAQFGAALCRETNAKSGSGANNTFKNNHAIVVGAALAWMGSIGIKIKNYTFINNSADVAGGAIYVSPTSHNCSVIDCNFVDNYVTNKTNGWIGGEQFSWTAWDGTRMAYVTDWTTEPSKIATADVLPTETIFYYNTQEDIDNALGNGGAITIYGANATVENTNFTGSSARLGGAIYVGATSGHTILNHTIFTSNVALERGGAVNLHASGVHIDDGKFYDNLAINGSAIYVGGEGTENKVHESIFRGNNATDYGGAIYWVAYTGEIYNSEFTQNNARWGGGIYFNGRSSNTNVINSTFKSNSAVKNGGAIECNASNIGIYNLTFEENIAGEYGAASCREIEATGGRGTNNTFIRNHAGISGAALAWMGVTDIHIVDYKFRDNTAENSGGAIFIDEGSNNDIIENCTFEGNHITNMSVNHNGGAIDCRGENLTIDYVDFTNNGAYTGGAIYMGFNSKNIRIFDSNFTSNYAMGDGGALGLKADSLTINNTIFKSNTAVRNGGAVYAGGNGTNNSIRHATFEGNSAGDHGGAIDWLSSAGIFEFINFRANTAEYGGGIYLNGVSSNSRLNHVYFIENRATKNGGAIDCNASMMGLNNTIFISNYAGEYGAALCREANATGGFGGNNSFIKNHAEIAGAALAWLGVDGININNYRFINNTAELSGGAIYVREDSPNCKVRNSYFENNKVNDVQNGQGGAIDWLGENGYIYKSTFKDSFANNGGTLFINSNNMNITLSNFTGSRALGEGGVILLMSNNTTITHSKFDYSVALERGGSISAHDAYNATIYDCIFTYSVGAGYTDDTKIPHGSGGAIFWINGNNLNISNSKFSDIESHAYGGALSIVNCNDSSVFNTTFIGMLAVQDGGSIYWINSTNVTFDLCNISDSAASYSGGAIYVENINDTRIINFRFNGVSTPWGNGGVLYIDGNVTMYNDTFTDFKASTGYAGAIYLCNGNSTLSNSSFHGIDAIWINDDATLKMTKNNITAPISNKNMTYLTEAYDLITNPVPYSVWNDGNLTLDKNNFDCLIFNDEGIIDSPTVIKILDNTTVYADWNSNFTFWASIYDDNNNTIISVSKLNTTNDVVGGWYPMSYNAWSTQVYYNGTFHISGKDVGLPNAALYNGTLNVLVETTLPLDVKQVNEGEHVTITATVPQDPNTITGNVTFVINGETYIRELVKGIATLDLYNLTENTYHVTATYSGDKNHFECQNTTQFIVNLRDTWVIISIQNYTYGIFGCANVTSNGNGTIRIYFNGRYEDFQLVNGTFNLTFDQIFDPGIYWMSVTYIEDGYYKYAMNQTSFEVYWLNTTINATPTDIKYGENELINVTVNKNATGYIVITIDNHRYLLPLENGTALFNLSGLAPGKYENIPVVYSGDNHFLRNSTNITFTVSPTDNFTIDVKVDNITYGQNATVMVLVATDALGNVTIYVDGVDKGTFNVTNGVVTLDVAGLAGGDHVVNVTYNGGPRYAPKDKNGTVFNVGPTENWDMAIVGDYKPYGENSTIKVTTNPYDLAVKNVTITIDGIPYVVNITDGVATLTLNNLSAGSHSASVSYVGDANYSSKTKNFFPSIPQATPTIVLTQNGTDLIATVIGVNDENMTGNFSFRVNVKEFTVTIVNGRNVTLHDVFIIGNNYVFAKYNGNQNYSAVETTGVFNVGKMNTTITVNTTNITYGQNEIINVTVNENATGFIAVRIGSQIYVAYINEGVANFNISGLDVGTYTAYVTFYSADNQFNGNSTTVTFRVDPTSDFEITVKVDNITYGQNATVMVLVATDALGNVTIYVDGVDKGTVNFTNGLATLDVAGLTGGDHVVNVTYNGGPRYTPKDKNNTVFNVGPNTSWKVTITDVEYKPYGEYSKINITDIPHDIKGDNLTIKIDGVSYVVPINRTTNSATLRLNNLSAGTHSATVNYDGDENYGKISHVFRPSIPQATPTITLTQNGTDVIATVSGNTTGNVTFYTRGNEYTIKLVNGNATLKNNLTFGLNDVVAIYNGDKNYTSARIMETFEIEKQNVTITIKDITSIIYVGNKVIFNATLNETVTGDIIFTINGANYTVHVDNAGFATCEYTPVNNETLTVVAAFTGNDMYNANSTSKDFVVNRVPVDVNVSVVSPIKVGENAVITVNMNVTINTTVQVEVGGKTYDVAIVNGKGLLNVSGLANATYKVNVTFAGDSKYAVAVNNTTLIVNKIADYAINVTATNITVGQNATVTVVLPSDVDPTKLVIKVGNREYPYTMVNGIATAIIPNLIIGEYEVNVTYKGDGKYVAKDKNGTKFKVTGTDVYSIIINVENHTYGEYSIINVTVPNDVENNVTITIDGVSYSVNVNATTGIATLRLNNLSGGLHSVVATYPGDDKYLRISNSTTFTVARASTTIDVNFDIPKFVGDNVVIYVELNKKVNGTVTLHVDNNNYTAYVRNGAGSYNIVGLINNTYNISASFAGDVNFTGSNSAVETLAVNKIPTNLTVTLSNDVIMVNETTVVNVKLNQTINATVTVKVNGKEYTVSLTNGEGTLTLSDLLNTTYTINATFAETDKYLGNTSNDAILKVNRIPTDINVSVKVPVTYGDVAVITVTMDPSINASVVVNVDGKNYTVAVVNGEGKLNVSGLIVKTYKVNVTYAGDSRHIASNNTTTFSVVPADLTAEVIGLNVTVSDNTKFIINVTEDFKGNVSIKVGDKVLYDGAVKAIVDGAILPTAGDKKATVVFYGDDNYNELTVNDVDFTVSTDESVIIVNVTEVTYPNTPIAKVNISNKANGTVNITVDGESFIKEITNGYVEIPLEDLNAGFKNATVKFISTDGYNSNMTVNYKFVINQADSHIDINITPEVIYVGGKAFLNITVSCTGEVKIYVDGKEYIRTLDENNKVYVTTDSLSAGEHTVYVYYPGDVNYKDSFAVKTFTVLEGNFIVNSTGFEYVTLAEAIAASNGTDTIIARPGTYTGEGNVGVEISGKNLTITGSDVIFDAEGANVNILTIAKGANVTLVGLTYANSKGNNGYGAVVNNGNLTVIGSEFVNNSAANGGAIYSVGALTVEESEFVNNTATSDGGAIYYNLVNGEFNVIDSTFIDNNATGRGGAIFVWSGLPIVKGSEFYNNTATANGGAICFYRAVGEIDGSYFENNTAVKSTGGAVNLAVGGAITNSEFVDNHAFKTNGAAIAAGGSNIYIANSNFTGINLIDITGTATLENNVELSAKVIDGYSVRLSGRNAKLTLIKNNFNTPIVNIVASGAILSEVNITVLDNKTWDTTEGTYTLNATIVDDNGNWIKDTFAKFTVNGVEVPAIAYDDSTGLYTAEFTLTGDRIYNVSMTRYADEYINIGILRNITGTFTELQKLIDEATGFITLDHNFAYDPVIDGEKFLNGVVIDKNMAMFNFGNDIVIDGKNQARIFNITNNSIVMLGDVTLANGNASEGGAVYVDAGSTLIANNIKFINNTATLSAGVIYADGDATISNSDFVNNTAITAQGIYVSKNGVLSSIEDSTFDSEDFIYNEGSLLLDNVTELSAKGSNYVIYNDGSLNLIGNHFNTTIYNDGVILTEVTITLNGNKTITDKKIGDSVVLNATFVDDNGNAINDPNFRIAVDGVAINDIDYDLANNLYTVNYVINHAGETLVSTLYENENVTVLTGIYFIPKFNATVNVTVDDIYVGENATVKVNVTGEPGIKYNETIIVTINSTEYIVTLENGFASFNVTGLTPGQYSVLAILSENANYTKAYGNDIFTVKKLDVPISVDDIEIVYGENATVIVKGLENIVGDFITINITGKESKTVKVNASGMANATFDNLAAGEYEIVAIYAGNATYAANSTTATLTVLKANSTISIDVKSIYKVGDDIVINFTVVNSTGPVTVTINGKDYTVVNNNVTIKGGLPEGEYIISAVLAGDENYNGSNASDTFNVVKNNITITINDITTPIVVGSEITIVAELNETVTGDVVFTINGANYTVYVDNDNKASVKYTPVNNETITVVATFLGNDKYNRNSTSKEFDVNRVPINVTVEFTTPIFVGDNYS
ncbi:Ig-like domain repeat protein [uncultured Methanobrevibacter sp.]|uniref:Ig-like domain repeat protein n=1 Tax=uncultured Methanobrevibacter sp. TaxID=253161 RepID=UPI0025CFD3E4|nr:Ig-like domain repeat protein [uncultured Methanobrevibacter sp.]